METEKNKTEILAVDQKVLTGEVEEWYQNVSLEDAEVFIRSNLQSAVRSVIATGFYLKHIRDNELYLEAGYKNINEYAMDRFGLSASATSRYITRNTRFSRGGNSPLIDDRFKDFSKSQLQEMLGMSDEQLEQVTPDMTVREIRSMARPKEVPYIEIPGQTELKDIPGVIPEEMAEGFEASTAELFDVEEDENMVQPVAGKPISQEIPITELVEEEDAEIATSQMDIEAPENEVKERTDIELLRELLERKKQLLSKCLGTPGIDKSDEHIRMQKLEVGALASMLCELEDLEEKKDRPKQPELPQLKNNDQRAAFIDAYETWPLWIDNQETGERYYRYDLPDGTSFVIKTYACDKVVEEDKRLQDFLHEMEFAKDRNERNRIATSLQQSRRTRRINKDMAKMNEKLVKFFEDQKNRDTLNRLRQLLGQQRKEEEYLLGERTYKPRAGMR